MEPWLGVKKNMKRKKSKKNIVLDWDDNFDFDKWFNEVRAMSDEEIDIYIEKYERDRLKAKLKDKYLMEWVVNGTIDFEKLFTEVKNMSEEEKNNYVEEIASYIQEYEKEV